VRHTPRVRSSSVLSKRAPVLDDASLAQATDRDAHSRMGPPETRPGAKTKSLQIRVPVVCRAFQAAEGTRTLDLLHGKQTLSARALPLYPCISATSPRRRAVVLSHVSSRLVGVPAPNWHRDAGAERLSRAGGSLVSAWEAVVAVHWCVAQHGPASGAGLVVRGSWVRGRASLRRGRDDQSDRRRDGQSRRARVRRSGATAGAPDGAGRALRPRQAG
jgi:hypothetical protein